MTPLEQNLRKSKWTQQQLLAALGDIGVRCSQSFMSAVKIGRRGCPRWLAKGIAQVMPGTDAAELVLYEPRRRAKPRRPRAA